MTALVSFNLSRTRGARHRSRASRYSTPAQQTPWLTIMFLSFLSKLPSLVSNTTVTSAVWTYPAQSEYRARRVQGIRGH